MIKKIIAAIMITAAILLIFGSMGALEWGDMTEQECICRTAVAFVVMAIAAIIGSDELRAAIIAEIRHNDRGRRQ